MNTHTLTPAFARTVALGQQNIPSREKYEAAMRDIFERRYYTNQGPLAREFEARLQRFLDVRHAVCVANATIGLMMAFDALAARGCALVPAAGNPALLHALAWCGVDAVACDAETANGQLSIERAARLIADGKPAVLVGANLWGGACDAAALRSLGDQHRIPVLFDSLQAFGSTVSGVRAGAAGCIEVFSFGLDDVLYAGGGACVVTDDDAIAARLRNIRSSYGAGAPVSVERTSNGRMSEAQAALGLIGLDDFATHQAHNRKLFDAYRDGLASIAGVRVIEPSRAVRSNHQTLVCEIDVDSCGVTRDQLIQILSANHVEARAVAAGEVRGAHAQSLPAAARIGASWLLLPIGARVSVADVAVIVELIASAVARQVSREGARA